MSCTASTGTTAEAGEDSTVAEDGAMEEKDAEEVETAADAGEDGTAADAGSDRSSILSERRIISATARGPAGCMAGSMSTGIRAATLEKAAAVGHNISRPQSVRRKRTLPAIFQQR